MASSLLPAVAHIPAPFLCPLSGRLMLEPVLLTGSGITFERADITSWLEEHGSLCPETCMLLSPASCCLVPNDAVREAVYSWATCDVAAYMAALTGHPVSLTLVEQLEQLAVQQGHWQQMEHIEDEPAAHMAAVAAAVAAVTAAAQPATEGERPAHVSGPSGSSVLAHAAAAPAQDAKEGGDARSDCWKRGARPRRWRGLHQDTCGQGAHEAGWRQRSRSPLRPRALFPCIEEGEEEEEETDDIMSGEGTEEEEVSADWAAEEQEQDKEEEVVVHSEAKHTAGCCAWLEEAEEEEEEEGGGSGSCGELAGGEWAMDGCVSEGCVGQGLDLSEEEGEEVLGSSDDEQVQAHSQPADQEALLPRGEQEAWCNGQWTSSSSDSLKLDSEIESESGGSGSDEDKWWSSQGVSRQMQELENQMRAQQLDVYCAQVHNVQQLVAMARCAAAGGLPDHAHTLLMQAEGLVQLATTVYTVCSRPLIG